MKKWMKTLSIILILVTMIFLARSCGQLGVLFIDGMASKIAIARIVLPMISVTCFLFVFLSRSHLFKILDQNADQATETVTGKCIHLLDLVTLVFCIGTLAGLIHVFIRSE